MSSPDIYSEVADTMLKSVAGQMSGLNKEQLVALMKAQHPDENTFRAFVQTMQIMAQAKVDEAMEKAKAGANMVEIDCTMPVRH